MDALELIIDLAEETIVPIGICVILPIIIVWLIMRRKTNETNKRTEVLLAVIEKNPDLDMEDLIRKMNPKSKTTKERLMGSSLVCIMDICTCMHHICEHVWIFLELMWLKRNHTEYPVL